MQTQDQVSSSGADQGLGFCLIPLKLGLNRGITQNCNLEFLAHFDCKTVPENTTLIGYIFFGGGGVKYHLKFLKH